MHASTSPHNIPILLWTRAWAGAATCDGCVPASLANRLQVQAQHPLIQLLASSPKQRQRQRHGQGAAAPVGAAAEGGGQQQQHYFPLRLSPAGARSLLCANFWVALLEAPLR